MILLITEQSDLTTDLVVARLSELGSPFLRLNVDRILKDVWIETRSDGSPILIDETNTQHRLESVRSILYRGHGPPIPDNTLSDDASAFAKREVLAHLLGALFSLDAYWVSHPVSIWRASQKVYQLDLARRIGFQIPRTLVTRRIEAALTFRGEIDGPTIAKPVTFGAVGTGTDELAIYTSRIPREYGLDEFRDIALAPVILQEEILKKRDVRVTVVGNQMVAVGIDSQASSATETDWRVPTSTTISQGVITLPAPLGEMCIELTRRLDLSFGAIDLVESRNGEYFFWKSTRPVNGDGLSCKRARKSRILWLIC